MNRIIFGEIFSVDKVNLTGLSLNEIQNLVQPEGYTVSHALQIANAIYKKKVTSFTEMLRLPKKLQLYLEKISEISVLKPVTERHSQDNSVKFLFTGRSGQQFETVLIPEKNRITVCVSTQSGCRMGCPFCVTAGYGFHGNLTAGDIIGQVLGMPHREKITHVVFMGMGEPLDNTENVLKACEILTSEWGMAISPKNVTVSTVGITPAVMTFLQNTGCNLTLSLFSPFSEERARIVPAERKYTALEIVEIMKNFPLRKKRRLSIAYIMMKDVNDSERHLEGLKDLLRGSGIRVNLIPYHSNGKIDYMTSGDERMMYFRHNLVISGISASIRRSRGLDISAACGLLASDIGKSSGK